jgi:hypothetical protein
MENLRDSHSEIFERKVQNTENFLFRNKELKIVFILCSENSILNFNGLPLESEFVVTMVTTDVILFPVSGYVGI